LAQYNIDTGSLDQKISSRYEVMMLANGPGGNLVSTANPLDVRTNNESIFSAPWDMQVARGKVPEVIHVNVFGYTPNVTTTFHTVWENTPTDIVYPTVGRRLNVASTSASDNSNASFLLTGVDENWDPVSEIIYLNGTTPVTTSNTFMRINGMVMTSPGTGQNTNVGIVDVQYGAGNPIAQVNAGFGKMQNAFYSVPRGYGLYIQNINIFAGESNQGNQPIWFEYRVLTKNNRNGVQLTILQTPFSNEYKVQRFNPVKYSEMTDVQWQIKTNSGTHGVGVILEAVLIADTAP
jgi:hypothetical protein